MRNFQSIILYEIEYIGRFSNLHYCIFIYYLNIIIDIKFVVPYFLRSRPLNGIGNRVYSRKVESKSIKMEGNRGSSYGGRFSGGDFDLIEFVKRPLTLCRLLCIVSFSLLLTAF